MKEQQQGYTTIIYSTTNVSICIISPLLVLHPFEAAQQQYTTTIYSTTNVSIRILSPSLVLHPFEAAAATIYNSYI